MCIRPPPLVERRVGDRIDIDNWQRKMEFNKANTYFDRFSPYGKMKVLYAENRANSG